MRIIKPLEIAGTIMSLFDEATEKVVIISPYYNFSRWKKFNHVVSRAMERGISLEFYVRQGERTSIDNVRDLGILPREINRLHAKLYFNEKEAIISSMNLNQSSDDYSLDIALQTETPKEYADVISFYEKFIQPRGATGSFMDPDQWLDSLDKQVTPLFKKEPFLELIDGVLTIHGDNRYTILISDQKDPSLILTCILSGKEYDYLEDNPVILDLEQMEIELTPAGEGYYSTIMAAADVKSRSLERLAASEAEMVANMISVFILEIEKAKQKIGNSAVQNSLPCNTLDYSENSGRPGPGFFSKTQAPRIPRKNFSGNKSEFLGQDFF